MPLSAKRLALATAIGLGTSALLFFVAGRPQRIARAAEPPQEPVMVVEKAVNAGSTVEADAVVRQLRPASYVPSEALTDPQTVVGRVAREDLVPGEVLLGGLLYPPGQSAVTTVLPVPDGKRAVTVAVDEVVGVAGFVMPGSRVDVIGTMDVNDQPITRVLLQDIQVLAIAQDARRSADPKAKVVSSATLAVTPKQAEVLILAADRGKIRLAMRGPDENKDVRVAAVTPAMLFSGAHFGGSRAASVRTVTRTVYVHERSTQPTPEPEILVIRGTTAELVNR